MEIPNKNNLTNEDILSSMEKHQKELNARNKKKKTISRIVPLIVCLCAVVFLLIFFRAKAPTGAKVHGSTYDKVVNDYRKAGFIFVRSKKIYNQGINFLNNKTVEKVSIAGNDHFEEDTLFCKLFPVTVYYHAKKE